MQKELSTCTHNRDLSRRKQVTLNMTTLLSAIVTYHRPMVVKELKL